MNKVYFLLKIFFVYLFLTTTVIAVKSKYFDENSKLNDLAAVGVTFLFVMGLRKILRENNYLDDKKSEPNLISNLDLVALGTVCDVVNLSNYN